MESATSARVMSVADAPASASLPDADPVYDAEAGSVALAEPADAASAVLAGTAVEADVTPAPELGGLLPPPAPVYNAPIVISKGGTYSGNWASSDPNVPAVTVTTTAPVTIVDCRVRGPGHLISSLVTGSSITVRNCAGLGLPAAVAGKQPGRFINLWQPGKLVAEYNTLTSTGGIYVSSGGASAQGVTVRYNKAVNIEGRLSDGAGGYSTTQFVTRQFIQLNALRAAPNVEIAWNQIVNEPWKSRVEDNISVYMSSGTAASPMLIHDNYVQGAYPADPVNQTFSGGGIITDGSTTSSTYVVDYVSIYNNQVVATSNYGLAIAAGRHVVIRNNRAISSGLLPDGRRIRSANVGAYLWGQPADIAAGTFKNNAVTNNYLGWMNAAAALNPYWFPSCSGTNTCAGNARAPSAVTRPMEAAELASWNSKLATAGIKPGSTMSN